jgi:hypothetical protein
MSDSNKKAPYSSLCIFGDKDGVILQTLLQLQQEGRLPKSLALTHITGFDEENNNFLPSVNDKTTAISGTMFTWPKVEDYQSQRNVPRLT